MAESWASIDHCSANFSHRSLLSGSLASSACCRHLSARSRYSLARSLGMAQPSRRNGNEGDVIRHVSMARQSPRRFLDPPHRRRPQRTFGKYWPVQPGAGPRRDHGRVGASLSTTHRGNKRCLRDGGVARSRPRSGLSAMPATSAAGVAVRPAAVVAAVRRRALLRDSLNKNGRCDWRNRLVTSTLPYITGQSPWAPVAERPIALPPIRQRGQRHVRSRPKSIEGGIFRTESQTGSRCREAYEAVGHRSEVS
jgi:hypothetical protein